MSSPAQATTASGARLLDWVVSRAAMSKEAKQTIGGAADIDAILKSLLENAMVPEAIRVVAAALPPREGVWWAWAAATHASRLTSEGEVPPDVAAALSATEKWIATPDDVARRGAWAAAEKVGNDSPAGAAAASAFFATGSIAPDNVAYIPAPPGIHSSMIGLAVMLSAASDAEHFGPLAWAYITQAIEVVKQVGGWEKSIEFAKAHFDAMAEQQAKALPQESAAASS